MSSPHGEPHEARRIPVHRKQSQIKVVSSEAVQASIPVATRHIRLVKTKPTPPPVPPAHKTVRLRWHSPREAQQRSVGDRYHLLTKIGEGGSGVVYRAKDQLLNMTVAIKILDPELTHDSEAVATLKQEARIAMQLSHRHIVRLHNLERVLEHYFLVMEYVEGSSLRAVLQEYRRLSPATVRAIVRVCDDALSYAHRSGVYHNDLKPDNLLLTSEQELKVIDFGVACLAHSQHRRAHILGTPYYMSPEQKLGEPVDATTDIYALAVIAFELLTGHAPYPADATLRDVMETAPQEMPGVPPATRAVLEKAVASQPTDRWESIKAFAAAFEKASCEDEAPAPQG